MRYFLIVGEASADLHASRLMRALKARDPEAEFMFMGGDLMAEEAGRLPLVHYREVAFMGIIPVLRNLGTIRRAAREVQQAMRSYRPDVVIPVDYAGFNMRYILPFVRRELSCPTIYYIAPKLWAWKRWRIYRLVRNTDLLLCILPFETAFFGQYGLPCVYVGNPCVEATLQERQARQAGALANRPQIALLCGSRRQELGANLPQMLLATSRYRASHHIVIAGAPGLAAQDYESYLSDYPDVELSFGSTYRIVSKSEAALVTSGTATLETALLGTPQIVCYRMGGQRILRWLWKHIFSVPYISLVNLILGREAVPELIGAEVEGERIAQELDLILPGGALRSAQLSSIEELRQRLGLDRTGELAAEAILSYLSGTKVL